MKYFAFVIVLVLCNAQCWEIYVNIFIVVHPSLYVKYTTNCNCILSKKNM